MVNISKTGIYRIINKINKKVYYGSASGTRGIKRRWYEHIHNLKNNKHENSYLQRAWNKYSEENFTFEIVMYCDPDKCLFFEQKCLDKYKSYNREIGYNINKTANNCLGHKASEETKIKMRLSKILYIETKKHRENIIKSMPKKPIIAINCITKEIIEFCSIQEAHRQGFNLGNIQHCLKGRRNHHKGYYWKYL